MQLILDKVRNWLALAQITPISNREDPLSCKSLHSPLYVFHRQTVSAGTLWEVRCQEGHGQLSTDKLHNHQRNVETACNASSQFFKPQWSERRNTISIKHKEFLESVLESWMRHCPVAPIRRLEVNDHWNLPQSHCLSHRSQTQPIAKSLLFVLESTSSNIFPAFPTASSGRSSPLRAHTHPPAPNLNNILLRKRQ